MTNSVSFASTSVAQVADSAFDNLTVGAFAVWVYPTTLAGDSTVIGKHTSSFSAYMGMSLADAAGNFRMDDRRNGSNPLVAVSTGGPITANQWNFLGGSFDHSGANADQKLFHGDESTSVTEVSYSSQSVGSGSSDNSSVNMSFGNIIPVQTWAQLAGSIGMVAVYSTTKSQSDFEQIRTSPDENDADLIGFYVFGTDGTTSLEDQSSNAHDGTFSGSVSSGQTVPTVLERFFQITQVEGETEQTSEGILAVRNLIRQIDETEQLGEARQNIISSTGLTEVIDETEQVSEAAYYALRDTTAQGYEILRNGNVIASYGDFSTALAAMSSGDTMWIDGDIVNNISTGNISITTANITLKKKPGTTATPKFSGQYSTTSGYSVSSTVDDHDIYVLAHPDGSSLNNVYAAFVEFPITRLWSADNADHSNFYASLNTVSASGTNLYVSTTPNTDLASIVNPTIRWARYEYGISINAANVTIEDIDFEWYATSCVRLQAGADGATITNSEMSHSRYQVYSQGAPDNVTLDNLTIFDAPNPGWSWRDTKTRNTSKKMENAGIHCYDQAVDGWEIKNCEIYNKWDGIEVSSVTAASYVTNLLIHDNRIHHCLDDAIATEGLVQGSEIYDNVVWGCYVCFAATPHDGNGTPSYVHGNIFIADAPTIKFETNEGDEDYDQCRVFKLGYNANILGGTDCTDLRIYNNTITSIGDVFQGSNGALPTGVTYYNNVAYTWGMGGDAFEDQYRYSAAEDASEDLSTGVNLTANRLNLGTDDWIGFRFSTSVPVPTDPNTGHRIPFVRSAFLELTAANTPSTTKWSAAMAYLDAATSPDDFSTTDLSSRSDRSSASWNPLTSAGNSYACQVAMTSGTTSNTYRFDITPIISEYLHDNYTQGNDIVIILFQKNNSSDKQQFWSEDSGNGDPVLEINTAPGIGLGAGFVSTDTGLYSASIDNFQDYNGFHKDYMSGGNANWFRRTNHASNVYSSLAAHVAADTDNLNENSIDDDPILTGTYPDLRASATEYDGAGYDVVTNLSYPAPTNFAGGGSFDIGHYNITAPVTSIDRVINETLQASEALLKYTGFIKLLAETINVYPILPFPWGTFPTFWSFDGAVGSSATPTMGATDIFGRADVVQTSETGGNMEVQGSGISKFHGLHVDVIFLLTVNRGDMIEMAIRVQNEETASATGYRVRYDPEPANTATIYRHDAGSVTTLTSVSFLGADQPDWLDETDLVTTSDLGAEKFGVLHYSRPDYSAVTELWVEVDFNVRGKEWHLLARAVDSNPLPPDVSVAPTTLVETGLGGDSTTSTAYNRIDMATGFQLAGVPGLWPGALGLLGAVRVIAEAEQLSEALLRRLVMARLLSDSVQIPETIIKAMNFTRLVSETVEASGGLLRALGLVRLLANDVEIADAVIRPMVLARLTAETVEIADDVIRVISSVASSLVEVLDETVEASETLARFRALVRLLANDVEIADAVIRPMVLARLIGETVEVAETIVRALLNPLTPIINEAIQVAEAMITPMGLVRILAAETVEISTGTLHPKAILKLLADSVWVNEVITRARVLARLIGDDVEISDTVLRALGFVQVVATETVEISSGTERYFGFVAIAVEETIQVSEVTLAGWVRFGNEAIEVSEAHLRVRGLVRSLIEIVQVGDQALRLLGLSKVISDTVEVSGVLSRITGFVRRVSDTVDVSEAKLTWSGFVLVLSETVEISDAMLRVTGLAFVISETVEMADALVKAMSLGRLIDDQIWVQESPLRARTLARMLGETVEVDTAVQWLNILTRLISDTVEIAENTNSFLGLVTLIDETVELNDSVLHILGLLRQLDENVHIDDVPIVARAMARLIADQVWVVESVLRSRVLTRLSEETVEVIEAISWMNELVRQIAEAVQITETTSVVFGFVRLVEETIQIAEAVSRVVGLVKRIAEEQQVNEAFIRGLGLAKVMNEVVQIGDAALRAMSMIRIDGEVIEVDETNARLSGLVRLLTETVEISDSALHFVVLNTLGSLNDTSAVFRNLLRSAKIITTPKSVKKR